MKLIYTGDFERLKDFGFEYDEYISKEYNYIFYKYKPNNSVDVIQIDINSKIIYLHDNSRQEGIIKLYDLIQAGLVKKEEENEKKN